MKVKLLAACAAGVLALAVAGAVAAQGKPTAADAKAFVDKAEADLQRIDGYTTRTAWVRATYIIPETLWLDAKAQGEQTELATKYAMEAAKYDGVAADPVTLRKLMMLKQFLTLPAPDRPGAAAELSALSGKLNATYSTYKFDFKGKPITLNDAEDVLRTSRDPAELKAVWEGWHTVSPQMRGDYAKLVGLSNEGAKGLGYADVGALWRSNYDMSPAEFEAETDRLWNQVEPFYKNLHCYVRGQLNAKYGDAVQPKTGPIRADLLGNMWAQEWGNIYDVVEPKGVKPRSYDLEKLLVAKGYDPIKMTKTADGFYQSIGFAAMPGTYYTQSMITRPKDREVVCHASAWDIDGKEDLRVKMCMKVTAEDFQVIHHEMGHNIYQRAYKDQSYLFKGSANGGFHEAIGDFAGLSAETPTYLNQIKLLDTVPGADEDIPFLLDMALDKIAFLPFGLLVDKYRWGVFSGQTTPEEYNTDWWALRLKYQGLMPPAQRPADAFDAAAKYHVAASVSYERYFMARIYQFQFHRAACRQIGWKGPLHRCSVYGQKEMGQKFNAMMEMGQSKPWPEALAAFTGEKTTDASAVADYFRPLNTWLTRQNKGQQCGW